MFWHSKHLHAPIQHGSGGWRADSDSPEIWGFHWDVITKSGQPPTLQSSTPALTVLRQELMRFVAFKVQFLRVFVDTTMQKITSFNIPLVSGE